MTKKIYILLLAVLGIGTFSSCADQLDADKYFRDRLTIESVFESKTHAEEWLAHAFSFLKGENEEVTTKNGNTNPFCQLTRAHLLLGKFNVQIDNNHKPLLNRILIFLSNGISLSQNHSNSIEDKAN